MTKPNEPKHITITIDVAPPKKGTRSIVVSGAPAGEMPVVHTGAFADLHALINATWAELQRREPQVPVIKAEKVTTNVKPAADAKDEDDDTSETSVDEPASQTTSTPAENDQLVVNETEALPEIAGDTSGGTTGDVAEPVTSEDVLEAALLAAHQEPHG